MNYPFDLRKADQVAAFFAQKAGGKINILKLIKLIYLAERESMDRYDHVMLNDHFLSMKHGPVLSTTLDYLNGRLDKKIEQSLPKSERFIKGRENHDASLTDEYRNTTDDDLLDLSKADITVLTDMWQQHGDKNQFELAELTHFLCPEWKKPTMFEKSSPIPYEKILTVLGKKNPKVLADRL